MGSFGAFMAGQVDSYQQAMREQTERMKKLRDAGQKMADARTSAELEIARTEWRFLTEGRQD